MCMDWKQRLCLPKDLSLGIRPPFPCPRREPHRKHWGDVVNVMFPSCFFLLNPQVCDSAKPWNSRVYSAFVMSVNLNCRSQTKKCKLVSAFSEDVMANVVFSSLLCNRYLMPFYENCRLFEVFSIATLVQKLSIVVSWCFSEMCCYLLVNSVAWTCSYVILNLDGLM